MPNRCLSALCVALAMPLTAGAQSSDAEPMSPRAVPTSLSVGYETWDLPGSERMGMVSGHLMFDVSSNLRLGVGSYGATRGNRGGFITLGVAGEYVHPLSPSWDARAGLFVGAGGGRGGYQLAGGGLMLRGDMGLVYKAGALGNFGFGVSRVSFPDGVITSTQPYLRYEHTFHNLLADGWRDRRSSASHAGSTLASRNQEFGPVLKHYSIPASVTRDDGSPQHKSLQLVGVEWVSHQNDGWFVKVEAEGAMGGQSDGYMQILAGGGYALPLGKAASAKLYFVAGPAGGGGVDTGGGLLAEAGLGLAYRLSSILAVEATVGHVRAPSAGFRATSLGLQLRYQFETPVATVARTSLIPETAGFDPRRFRIRAAHQRYEKADEQWRTRSSLPRIDNLGVQVDHFFAGNWYLSGQGLAAYRGDAGAYMVGLVGAGYQWRLSRDWFVDLEALIGAAGGGGMAVSGGLVTQVNAGIGYRLTDSIALMATVGRIAALRGPFEANVGGLSVSYQFTGFAKK